MIDASGFGVYVHWPYCAAICPYCDFNVYRERGADTDALTKAICADIAGWRDRTGPLQATSLYFGGGTPSRMSPGHVGAIIETAFSAWDFSSDAEITLEMNPDDAARLEDFFAAGVNRVSIGAQAFDDRALADLGRWHSAADARHAIERACAVFHHVTFDLIYARSGQSIDAWRRELKDALSIGAEHVSLYQLTVEAGTAFEKRASRGELDLPDGDASAEFYDATQDVCDAAGLPAYEVSNHAKSLGARSRHNLLYWRGAQWAGVGPGAAGRLGALGRDRRETRAAVRPAAYVDRVASAGWGAESCLEMSRRDQTRELLLMGLRLRDGVELAALEHASGAPFDLEGAAALAEDGLITIDKQRIRVSDSARALVDRIALELAPD